MLSIGLSNVTILTPSCLQQVVGKSSRPAAVLLLRRAMSVSSPSPAAQSIQVDDATLSYRVESSSEGSGPPCLLLPGALGTAVADFAGQFGPEGINKSGKISSLIAWDPPGYGDSRPPERTWPGVSDKVNGPTFYHRDAKVADQMMKALGHDKYSVVGWSDGGITALIMAAMYPSRVSKIVSFAGNAYYIRPEIEGLEGLKDVSQWSERMRTPMEETYGKERFPILWSDFVDACVAIMNDRDGNICKDLLHKITCPTLIVHGEKDALVAPEHPQYLKESIKGSRIEIFPDGKHNLHKKYAKEFNQIVSDFLTSS